MAETRIKLPTGPTDRLRDVGVDAQYQYLTNRHRISAHVNYVRERVTWNQGAPTSNRTDELHALRAKATYYFDRWFGINVVRFRVDGNADPGLHATGDAVTGNSTGSPDG